MLQQLVKQLFQGIRVATNYRGARTVTDGDVQTAVKGRNGRLRLAIGQLNDAHGPFAPHAAEQLGAAADNPRRLVQRKNPGDISGGQFAHTMADNGVRFHPPGLPHCGQANLQSKERGLQNVNLF